LQSPETESQNRRYRDLSGRQRPHAPCLNPRKCPHTAGFSSETEKRRFASDCVVVDAAPIEPVSSVEIPRKLGKYWEFRSFWTLRGPNRRAVSKACRQNSHARELGIYFKEMGKRKTEKRNKRKTGKRKIQDALGRTDAPANGGAAMGTSLFVALSRGP
jgi:hypothetical protein